MGVEEPNDVETAFPSPLLNVNELSGIDVITIMLFAFSSIAAGDHFVNNAFAFNKLAQ